MQKLLSITDISQEKPSHEKSTAVTPSLALVALPQRTFNDYKVGFAGEFGDELVEQQEIINFAQKYDPQFIHTDTKEAENGPFGGLIASGWLTAAITMRIFVQHYFNEHISLGGVGVEELKFLLPVRAGDRLRARFTILEARKSGSDPSRAVLVTMVETLNQNDQKVLSMKTISLIKV